ncbi:hypothetical protein Cgig2_033555 [Carnegiea gigantea]|uniref:Uncharacterized protein n=1 Tax=Carnegiea gigantea TaxID=171969 RepID=A0A9Q1JTW8_9CARY|nr:hypothetical protein Cgig2_033555 [Carnegiea gigantea]
MEVMATIAEGYAKGLTRSAWKAQLRGTQQALTAEQGTCVTVPTMMFGGREVARFASRHNDPLVVKMKVANAIVRRTLINTGSPVDIITWDCLQKLTYPARDIVPLVHPILGFGGQEMNPTRMIRLPLHFDDGLKARNLEVDCLVVDVPMAYNVILGRLTLHKVWFPYPCPLARRWDELHLLRIPVFGLSPLALLYVVKVGLKGLVSPVPCRGTPCPPHGPAGSPTPRPYKENIKPFFCSSLDGYPKGFLTGHLGRSAQPMPRWINRKSYFQCFTFGFFSMAIIYLDLLLKQYQPRYETSTSGLRILGVEEYSKLDHAGVSGSKRGTA